MIFMNDALFESGMKNRLKALAEIGELLQLAEWQDGYEPQLYHIGGLISSTIEDFFEELDELDGLNREDFLELKAKLPPDPIEKAKEREQGEAFSTYLAEQLIRLKPELEKPLKKLLTPKKKEEDEC